MSWHTVSAGRREGCIPKLACYMRCISHGLDILEAGCTFSNDCNLFPCSSS